MPPVSSLCRQIQLYKSVRPSLLVASSSNDSRRLIHHGNTSSNVAAAHADVSLSSEVDTCYNKLDLNFENGKEAFKVRILFVSPGPPLNFRARLIGI